MATIDRDILTIVEPTIELDEVFVEDEQSVDAQEESSPENDNQTMQQQTMEGGLYPMVQIGTNKILMEDLVSMELSNDDFIPTATFIINDSLDKLSDVEYPLDGDVVSLYLKPRPIAEYRPIRIDFDISNITSSPAEKGGEEDDGKPAQFNFQCVMKIPLLYADVVQGFAVGNSFDHLLECAEGLGVGFASNEDGTDDTMPRICADTSRDDFISETTLSAYKDDESFFTSYIDNHYYLNFVNVNKQFSEEDVMEEIPAVAQIDYELQAPHAAEGEEPITASLRLSNGQDVKGTNMEITKFNLLNNTGDIWMANGYRRNIKYLNMNENNTAGSTGGLEQFLITPLNTPGAEENRIPMRGRASDPAEIWENNTKAKYLGKQPSEDFENVHPNYMYAICSNMGNNSEIQKMQMEVELSTVNWSLYRYQRIPVILYNIGEVNNKNLENRDAQLGENVQPVNDESEDTADAEANYEGPDQMVKNEFLSGYYVISEITYKYTKGEAIGQKLKLLRREWPISARLKDN